MKMWRKHHLPDPEFALMVLCVAALIVLLMLILMAGYVRAGACLSIDVPPQAVIGQPDGDTFHIFSFQPGGVIKIRVQGVNTPERGQPGWMEAKSFTKGWLDKGSFRVNTCGKPTIDRIVGIVERDGRTLAQDLIAAGLAK